MYSLLSIFILTPLIFSHTFSRLGEDFVIDTTLGSFESVKVYVFFFLLFLSTLEILSTNTKFFSKKTLQITGMLLLFLVGEYLLFGGESVFGIGEKQHGSLFFASLFWLWYLLTYIDPRKYRIFIRAIIFSSTIVALTALGEMLFEYNLFTGFLYDAERSWGSHRATATLGNPNYVAGYLLMCLPFFRSLQGNLKQLAGTIFLFFGIVATGSFIGITLFCYYFLFLILEKFWKQNAIKILLFALSIGIFILYFSLDGTEKWLSLSSRFILMKETLLALGENSISLFIGNGPNGVIEHYNSVRTKEIMNYFPDNMLIDSSHNIFVDLIFRFGLPIIFCIIFVIKKHWKSLSGNAKLSIILGTLFFSLNVPILSAYILFVFAFAQKNAPH